MTGGQGSCSLDFLPCVTLPPGTVVRPGFPKTVTPPTLSKRLLQPSHISRSVGERASCCLILTWPATSLLTQMVLACALQATAALHSPREFWCYSPCSMETAQVPLSRNCRWRYNPGKGFFSRTALLNLYNFKPA